MIMKALRERTRASHGRIEACIDLPTRVQSLKSYRQLLGDLLGYYEPLEIQLVRFTQPDFDFAALPQCNKPPDLTHFAQALGCLYVLEGATLGGQIIARQLRQSFNFDAQYGAAFFNGYGAQTAEKWKTFGAALTFYATSSELEDTIIQAADETFLTLEQWLVRRD